MKNRIKVVSLLVLAMMLVMTACSNNNEPTDKVDTSLEVVPEELPIEDEVNTKPESEPDYEVVVPAKYDPEKIEIHDIEVMPTQEELDNSLASNGKTFTNEEYATIEDPTDGGLYRVMFPKAVEVDERASGWETNPDRVIAIHYDYQNISVEKDEFYVCYCWFRVLDEQGNELALYPLQRDKADRIKVGQQGYGLNGWELYNNSEKVYIEYFANGHFEGTPLAKFEIPITVPVVDETVENEAVNTGDVSETDENVVENNTESEISSN